MYMRCLILSFMLSISLICFGSGDETLGRISDVAGMVTSQRGRAVTLIQPLDPEKCAIVFIYSEHPDLTKDTVLEKIAPTYIRTIIPDCYDEVKNECADLNHRLTDMLQNTISQNIKQETPSDLEEFPKTRPILNLLSIILTPRRMHIFEFQADTVETHTSSNGLSDTWKDEHHIATGKSSFLGGSIWGSGQRHKDINAQELATMLQRQDPKQSFHFVIDNALWRDLCAAKTAM